MGGPSLMMFVGTAPTEGAPSLRFLQEPGGWPTLCFADFTLRRNNANKKTRSGGWATRPEVRKSRRRSFLIWHDKRNRPLVEGVVVRVIQFDNHFVWAGRKMLQDDGVPTRVGPHP